MYEDEISFRYYIRLLMSRWKWIVGVSIVAALAAFITTSLQESDYEATAAVAVVRSRTSVNFDETIQTLDDYQLEGGRLDPNRLAALVALAKSNEVLLSVLDDVGDQLSPEARTIQALRNRLTTSTSGDLMEFTARHHDPEIAALLADSWARSYVDYTNRLYGSTGGDSTIIASQVATAREAYEAAQEALQQFLADDEVLALRRTLERELTIKKALMDSYQQSLVAVEANDASELAQLESWLADAQTLREQVRAGSGSDAAKFGDTLALILLRSRVYSGAHTVSAELQRGGFALTGSEPIGLQLSLSEVGSEGISVADVDNLISVLEARRETTQARIDDLAGDGLSGNANGSPAYQTLGQRIAVLNNEIIALETQLETEVATRQAQQQALEAARDRAWDAYQALTAQQVETAIQAQSGITEVRVADLALTPEAPVSSAVVINVLLAIVIGMLVTIGLIFFLDWWHTSAEQHVDQTGKTADQEAQTRPRTNPAGTGPIGSQRSDTTV